MSKVPRPPAPTPRGARLTDARRRPGVTVRTWLTITIAFGLGLAAACSAGGSAPDRLADGASPVALPPVPTGDIVLTIRHRASGEEIDLDLAGIESLGAETITVDEPFVGRELEFTAVDVDSVLAAAGVAPDAPLTWTALDEYQVHFNRRAAAGDGALLATRLGGEPIEVADGGPIRVVFPDGEGELAQDTNQWIWSLYLVEVG